VYKVKHKLHLTSGSAQPEKNSGCACACACACALFNPIYIITALQHKEKNYKNSSF